MPTLDTMIDSGIPVRAVIYGAPGTGKTFMLGKLAERYNVHYISLEQGHTTLANPACVKIENRSKINLYSVLDTPSAPRAYLFMKSMLNTGKVTACVKHGGINCLACTNAKIEPYTFDFGACTLQDVVIIDTYAQYDSSLRSALEAENAHNVNWEASSSKKVHGASNDMLRYWNAVSAINAATCKRIQAMSHTNVIVITHVLDTRTEDNPTNRCFPLAGTSKFASTFSGYFSEVIYTYVQNGEYRASTDGKLFPLFDLRSRTDFSFANKKPADGLLELLLTSNRFT